jgi:hypothetical protein
MKIKENLDIFVYDFDLHHNMKRNIMQTILESGDFQNKKTNVQAYMTNWWIKSRELNIFTRWLEQKIYWNFDLLPKPAGESESLTLPLHQFNCWGAVYNRGDYTLSHKHNPFYISFVYFVNSPKGSSPLTFTTTNKKIKAEEGRVVVFNSNLFHHVPKNNCDNRVIVAGNYAVDFNSDLINRPV